MGQYTYNNPNSIGLGEGADSIGSLADFLKQKQQFEQKQAQTNNLEALARQHDLDKMQASHDLDAVGSTDRLNQAQDYSKAHPGMGVSVSKEGASITPPPPMAAIAVERQTQAGMKEYSKRLGNYNGFSSALKDVEDATNKDGKGGVVSNPDARLSSTGGLKSALPDSVMGLGEMIGLAPKGSTDERKTLARLQIEYQKAMSGLRVTDQARAQEKAAMGWISSGDPDLVAKGVRALAKNVAHGVKTAQSGFTNNVTSAVHDNLGGDPMEQFANVYDDHALHSPATASPTPAAAPAISFEEFKARKAAGKL